MGQMFHGDEGVFESPPSSQTVPGVHLQEAVEQVHKRSLVVLDVVLRFELFGGRQATGR